jgi:hypothetical protein
VALHVATYTSLIDALDGRGYEWLDARIASAPELVFTTVPGEHRALSDKPPGGESRANGGEAF